MRRDLSSTLAWLFAANLALQVWDGLATYYGLQLGLGEGNPLLRQSIEYYGTGWALIIWKTFACSLLFVLRWVGSVPLVAEALVITASSYFSFSLVPWAVLLFL